MTYNDRLNVIEYVSKKVDVDHVRIKTAILFDEIFPQLESLTDAPELAIEKISENILKKAAWHKIILPSKRMK